MRIVEKYNSYLKEFDNMLLAVNIVKKNYPYHFRIKNLYYNQMWNEIDKMVSEIIKLEETKVIQKHKKYER